MMNDHIYVQKKIMDEDKSSYYLKIALLRIKIDLHV